MENKVKWVVQKTIAGDRTLNRLTSAISKSGAVFELVELAPFSESLLYESIDEFIPIIYGSTTFMLLAYQDKYLSSGVFFDKSKFLMSEYIKHWGLKVLNNDAVIFKAGDIDNLKYDNEQMFFVRPNEDTKALAGSLIM